jgi:energy-coupling factor transporter ATP-binding protein EcfA2
MGEVISAPLGQVLLVAGPSGSGKSTFMDQLAAGSLPEAIRSELPCGCETWKRMAFRNFPGFFGEWPASKKIDIVIHYDTMNAHYMGWTSFFEDPRLHAIARAESVVAVTLRPTPDQLWGQCGRRAYGGMTPAQTRRALRRARLSAVGRNVLRRSIGAVNRLLHGRARLATPKQPSLFWANVVDLYRQPDWVAAWTKRWDALIAFLATDGPLEKALVVAPAGDAYRDLERGWVLLAVAPRHDGIPPTPAPRP